jgi:hypothetical protein
MGTAATLRGRQLGKTETTDFKRETPGVVVCSVIDSNMRRVASSDRFRDGNSRRVDTN